MCAVLRLGSAGLGRARVFLMGWPRAAGGLAACGALRREAPLPRSLKAVYVPLFSFFF